MQNNQERQTLQRTIILNELKKLYTHPTANDLFKIVKKKLPQISIVTIYRNLEYLEKKGLILKLNFKDKESHYDGHTEKHHHFICKNCGKIIDVFEDIKISQKALFQKYHFNINTDHLEFYGICNDCKLKNNLKK